MNLLLYQINYLIIALGCLIFIVFLFQKTKGSFFIYKNHIFFILTGLAIAFWATGRYFILIVDTKELALFWAQTLTFFHVLIYTFFIHFIAVSLGIPQKRGRFFIFCFYISAIFIGFLFLADLFFGSNLLISDISSKLFFPWYETAGSLHYLVLLHALFALLYVALEMIIYNIKNKEGGFQVLLVSFIILVGFLGGNTSYLLTYDINIPPFGIPLVVVQLLSTIYYLARYRFSDLKIIARNIYTNIAVSFFVFCLFLSGYFLIANYLKGPYSELGLFLVIFLSLLFVVCLGPIINYTLKDSKTLFLERFKFKKNTKELIINFNNSEDLDEILQKTREGINNFLLVKDIYIEIFKEYKKDQKRIRISPGGFFDEINIKDKKETFRKFLKKESIVDPQKSININKDFSKIIEKAKIKVITPLSIGDDFLGVIILGEKISKEDFNIKDIEFLELIANQASLAINKVILHQESSKLNNILNDKVKKQKRVLKQQADHFEKILQMKSEFLDIASHQLRTPVTAISGALSMVLDDSFKGSKKEKEFLKTCFERSLQLTDIIDDILRASTVNTEKLELVLEAIDIKEMLIKIYNNKKEEVENKKLDFTLDLPEKKPAKVVSDKRYLEEIITNLINNAIQYTKKGFIKIELHEDWQQNKVLIKVIDSGIGIPKEDQEKLFQKFSRAKNADKAFSNGSGLGLFIVKQVADSQDGMEIYIEDSKPGEGTTFTLEIPMVS